MERLDLGVLEFPGRWEFRDGGLMVGVFPDGGLLDGLISLGVLMLVFEGESKGPR
jgi:hypothetical protein